VIFRIVLIVALGAALVAVVLSQRNDDTTSAPNDVADVTGPTPPFGIGPVPAGLHDFAVFSPQLSMVFGDGWTAVVPPDDDQIVLEGPIFLAISRPNQVVKPGTQNELEPAPDDIIEWIATHKDLDATEPVATALGERAASAVDATAIEGAKIFAFSASDAILLGRGDMMRLIVSDVNGTTVAALMIAPPADFDQAVAAGQELLDTLRFEEGA
jgi:hypothetical protein